jgi:hypothetical protein
MTNSGSQAQPTTETWPRRSVVMSLGPWTKSMSDATRDGAAHNLVVSYTNQIEEFKVTNLADRFPSGVRKWRVDHSCSTSADCC